jgi:carbonic anhydrase
MRQLLHGVRVFQNRVFPAFRARFEKLATGQKPSTLFITCSDSRIVPHLLTQTEPGELFVLRNAGNIVSPQMSAYSGEAATIEFAVKVLGVEQIVVCGHSDCGAMKGVLNPESVSELPAVRRWLKHTERSLHEVVEQGLVTRLDDDPLTATVQANVVLQLRNLRTYPAIAEAESRGELALDGWFYRFEKGEVFAFDETSREFVSELHVLTTELSVA